MDGISRQGARLVEGVVGDSQRFGQPTLGCDATTAPSQFVANVMRQLAGPLGADGDLWEIVVMCHDLDFFKT